MLRIRFGIAFLSIFFVALSSTGMAYAAALQGSEWKPVRIGAIDVPEESSAFIRFRSKGRLSGFSGCNDLFAEYQAKDGVVFVGPVAATRTICDERVMVRESAIAAALESARTFQRDGVRLVFFDQHRQPVIELRQIDWD